MKINLIYMVLLQKMVYIIMDFVVFMNMLLDLVHIHHQMISILFQNPLAMSEGCIVEMMQDFIHITDHNSKLYIYYLN